MSVITGTLPDGLAIDDALLRCAENAAAVTAELYGAKESEVSLTFTDNGHIRELNKKYRGIDRETDVLSFAFDESDEPRVEGADSSAIGEIIISIDKAKSQAKEYGHSLERETAFLTVHGMLHLLGYDHIEDDEREEMEAEQRFVMKKLGIER